MSYKAPGKHYRKGITLIEVMDMFPTEEAAHEWFVRERWPEARHCPRCGSCNTTSNGGVMAFWCPACRRRFSVRTGTAFERSKIPLRKWAIAIYLILTNLKSVSSMKLHRDLGVTQKTSWFMLHRLREAWADEIGEAFHGPIEVDETYVGGKRKNMPKAKREILSGRGSVGKVAVVGAKDRASNQVSAKVVESTDKDTLHAFVADCAADGATVYTDDAKAYEGLPFNHDTVKHSVAEYVRGQVHTNGVESFWSMLKRAHKGTFHKMSAKHLNRYVQEFAGKHNLREEDTLAQMTSVVAGMVGKRLMYSQLTADNGQSPTA